MDWDAESCSSKLAFLRIGEQKKSMFYRPLAGISQGTVRNAKVNGLLVYDQSVQNYQL